MPRFSRAELQSIRDKAVADGKTAQAAGNVLVMRAFNDLAFSADRLDAMFARAIARKEAATMQTPTRTTSAERGDITQPIEELEDLETEDEDEEDGELEEVEDDGQVA